MSSLLTSLAFSLTVGTGNVYGLYSTLCVQSPQLKEYFQNFDTTVPLFTALEKMLETESINSIDSFLQTREKYRHFDIKKRNDKVAELEKQIKALRASKKDDSQLVDLFIEENRKWTNHLLFHMGLERKKFLEGRSTKSQYKDKLVELFLTMMKENRVD